MSDSKFCNNIGGINVTALAEQFGTPLFVYDQAVWEQRVQELHAHKRFR